MTRRSSLLLLFVFCAFGSVLGDVISDYQARVEKLSHDAVFADLEKHPERWDKLSMKLKFRIDPSGRIHDIQILSGFPNQWAEQTVRHALTELRLPPVPEQVMRAARMNGCNSAAEFAISKKQSDQALVLRVHKNLHW
jgi:hypothetical protein